MKIYVGGSLRDVPRDPEMCREVVAALGTAIISRDHVLTTSCRGSLDQEIAIAAQQSLRPENANDRVISYCLDSDTPVHSVGTSVAQICRTGE